MALEANRVSHSDPDKREQTGPALSSRALAIIHLAMYDAFAGAFNNMLTHPRYLPAPPPPPPGTSARDAVAGAAHTTLVALFKTQKDFFDAQLDGFDQSDPSFVFGVAVGNAILALRANDPDDRDRGYKVWPDPGRHRPDPDNPGQGFHAPFYGMQSKCFAVTQRWSLDRPPYLKADKSGYDPDYEKALRDVRGLGIKPELMGTLPSGAAKRTAEQSLIGTYWAYDGANRLGTPPRMYNQIIRKVAVKQGNTEADNARLFAFVNAAMGDAGILAWEQKYCHDFWRPVLGLREHDASCGPAAGNPQAANDISEDADPYWLPLGAPSTNTTQKNFTPPFPAYPSGHATFGAAAFHVTRLFYDKGHVAGGEAVIDGGKPIIKAGRLVPDDLFEDLSFVSEEMNGGNQDNNGTVRPKHVRNFDRDNAKPWLSGGLGKMIIENAESRVYLGVHWIFDAFKARGHDNRPDFSKDGLMIGGVPLGLKIAEDIFKWGGEKAPVMSPATADPKIETPPAGPPHGPVPMPTVPVQPGDVGDCANTRDKEKAVEKAAAEGSRVVQRDFKSGISPRQ